MQKKLILAFAKWKLKTVIRFFFRYFNAKKTRSTANSLVALLVWGDIVWNRDRTIPISQKKLLKWMQRQERVKQEQQENSQNHEKEIIYIYIYMQTTYNAHSTLISKREREKGNINENVKSTLRFILRTNKRQWRRRRMSLKKRTWKISPLLFLLLRFKFAFNCYMADGEHDRVKLHSHTFICRLLKQGVAL